MPGNERNRGVRALDPLMNTRDRVEHLVGIKIDTGYLRLQLVREHIHEQLGVARCVEVPAVNVKKLLGQLASIGEVAVVDERDAVWGVHVEGLRLLLILGIALRRVPNMTETHVADEIAHVAGAVGLPHLATRLLHVQGAALCCSDPGGVLATVLQQQQRVVDLLVDRLG